MKKYLIIDDEPIAHEIIQEYCDLIPGLVLAKNCFDALEALEFLRNNTVDLIFLDLNMPKLKGFDFLKSLANPPKVIVTTAYQEYALEGYELAITDYLLKPFSFERFLKAVNKALQAPKSYLNNTVSRNSAPEYIFIYSDKKHIQVKVDDILYIQAAGNYCKIMLEENQIMVRKKLSEMIDKLNTQKFLRVHKSFVVAIRKITSIEGNRIAVASHFIPIGKIYKTAVDTFIQK